MKAHDNEKPSHPRQQGHPRHAEWVEAIRTGMLEHWKHAPDSEREARAELTRQVSVARWQKRKWRSKAARSAFMAYVSSHIKERTAGGRPRSKDRCPCGLFTRAYAERRRHRCEASNAAD